MQAKPSVTMPPEVLRSLERLQRRAEEPALPAPAPAPEVVADEPHPFAPGGLADQLGGEVVELDAYRPAPRQQAPARTAKPDVRPLVLRSACDIAQPLRPIPWLCKALGLAPGRPVIISGYGGIGKTFAVQAFALAVAAGHRRLWDCYEMQLDQPGRVLHLDGEQGQWITDWRYQRLAWSMGVDLAALGDRLQTAHYPGLHLTAPDALERLVALCQGVTVCIIDSLRAFTPGVDENDSAIGQYLYMLAEVSERTGCTFVIVAHEGKTSGENPRTGIERLRGSSAIAAAAGSVVSFVKSGDEGCVRIEHTRANLGAPAAPETIRLVDEGDVDPVTEKTRGIRIEWMPREQAQAEAAQAEDARREQLLAGVADRIVAVVARAPSVTGAKAIEKVIAVKRETLMGAWQMAVAQGRLVNTGGAGRAARWVVASSGGDDAISGQASQTDDDGFGGLLRGASMRQSETCTLFPTCSQPVPGTRLEPVPDRGAHHRRWCPTGNTFLQRENGVSAECVPGTGSGWSTWPTRQP